jgi:hypothetical protein
MVEFFMFDLTMSRVRTGIVITLEVGTKSTGLIVSRRTVIDWRIQVTSTILTVMTRIVIPSIGKG